MDKIWYDWQAKSTLNKYAFGGGSSEAVSTFALFTEFPTGLPPYLGVSASSVELVRLWSLMRHALLS